MADAALDETGKRIVYVHGEDRQPPKVVVRDLASGSEVTLGGTPPDAWGPRSLPTAGMSSSSASTTSSSGTSISRRSAVGPWGGTSGPVNDLDFSDDGRMVTAGSDHTVRVWDSRGRTTVVMRGFEDEVSKALFMDDGRQVLADSLDGTIRLLDARTGKALAVFDTPEAELDDLDLSRDDRIATVRHRKRDARQRKRGANHAVRLLRQPPTGSRSRARPLPAAADNRPAPRVPPVDDG